MQVHQGESRDRCRWVAWVRVPASALARFRWLYSSLNPEVASSLQDGHRRSGWHPAASFHMRQRHPQHTLNANTTISVGSHRFTCTHVTRPSVFSAHQASIPIPIIRSMKSWNKVNQTLVCVCVCRRAQRVNVKAPAHFRPPAPGLTNGSMPVWNPHYYSTHVSKQNKQPLSFTHFSFDMNSFGPIESGHFLLLDFLFYRSSFSNFLCK